jgi:hypothetical protein
MDVFLTSIAVLAEGAMPIRSCIINFKKDRNIFMLDRASCVQIQMFEVVEQMKANEV